MPNSAANQSKEVDDFVVTENFAELLEESFQNEKKAGDIVQGVIVGTDNDFVIVDAGLKAEGLIDKKEFAVEGDEVSIEEGEKIDVYIESLEDREGRPQLSRERVVKEKEWIEVRKNHDDNATVEGAIVGRVKGGFIVQLKSLTAFLPGSQVDVRPMNNIDNLANLRQPFKVLKMDDLRGNVVVSRRAILEESHKELVDKALSTIEEGQVLDGVVKNLTDYGAFIDLGNIDGLVHIADISWSRISHPSEILTLGQKLQVKVIKYDKIKRQVSLGIKQLEHDPWEGIVEKYKVEGKYKGHITNITDYGIFVEIEKGIEGLVHVSEISWSKSNCDPRKFAAPGQEVDVSILEVDVKKHRISLSIKQCIDNPWNDFAAQNKSGSTVEGEIKSVNDFGLIVTLADNIEGLVHSSDLAWKGDSKESLKAFKAGDKVKVMILDIDVEKEKVSLGIKQLEHDPFSEMLDKISANKVVTCTVVDVRNDGIEVSLVDGVNSFIRKSDLSQDKSEQRSDRFAVGERIDAKITKIDKSSRKVNLSIKALEIEEQAQVIKEYGSTDSGASLGDILGSALGEVNSDNNKK